MTEHTPLFYIGLGALLLLAGRQLFWVFVGIVGFVAGFDFAQYAFAGQPEAFVLIAALCCAFISIILAVFFQELVVILAGAVAGGTIAVHWLSFFITYDPASPLNWAVFVFGAIVGGALMFWVFDIALVIVSCILGASLIVNFIPGDGMVKAMAEALLICLGVYVQGIAFDAAAPKRKPVVRRQRQRRHAFH